MVAQLSDPPKPSKHYCAMVLRGPMGAPTGPHYVERHKPLGQQSEFALIWMPPLTLPATNIAPRVGEKKNETIEPLKLLNLLISFHNKTLQK